MRPWIVLLITFGVFVIAFGVMTLWLYDGEEPSPLEPLAKEHVVEAYRALEDHIGEPIEVEKTDWVCVVADGMLGDEEFCAFFVAFTHESISFTRYREVSTIVDIGSDFQIEVSIDVIADDDAYYTRLAYAKNEWTQEFRDFGERENVAIAYDHDTFSTRAINDALAAARD